MAQFEEKEINLTAINNGEKYANGDIVDADAINAPIEASAWAQKTAKYVKALATNQPDISEIDGDGNPSVTISQMSDGSPQFKFSNLKGIKVDKTLSIDGLPADAKETGDRLKALEENIDTELSTESENPVQNKVVTEALNDLEQNLTAEIDAVESDVSAIFDFNNIVTNKIETLENTTENFTAKTNEMQRDIKDLYLIANATVTGTEEVTQEYSERQTADGLSGLIDGALTRVTKIEGNTVKSANIFDRYNFTGTSIEYIDEKTVVKQTMDGTYKGSYIPIKNPEQYIGKTLYVSAKWIASRENKGGIRVTWRVGTTLNNSMLVVNNEENGVVKSGVVPAPPEGYTGLYVLLYSNTVGTGVVGDTVTYTEIMVSTENVPYQPYFTGFKNSYFKGVKSTNSDGTKTDESFMLENAVELGLGVTIDIQNKKIIDNSRTIVLTGEENWGVGAGYTLSKGYFSALVLPILKTSLKRAKGIATVGYVDDSSSGRYHYGDWWVGVNNNRLFMIGAEKYFNFNITLTTTPTEEEKATLLAEWKAYLAQRYTDGNPVTIRYVSTTGTETDIEIPTDKYQAWVGGTETQVQGDINNSEYGANNTITQTYAVIKGGAE